jgi:ubiquinone/menaquinone biosynthesis C-methylase UbiE
VSGSVAFDRAADDYDRTRALSPSAMAKVTATLETELRGRGRCLEIGVGSGRIALPLWQRGVPMVGVDLSDPMLRRLVDNAGGSVPFPLVRADATRIPFASGSFSAGVACHVLHLIPGWRDSVAELVRVIRPGGLALVDVGGWGIGWWRRVLNRFSRETGIPQGNTGANEEREVDEAMAGHGARLRLLPPVWESRTVSVEEGLRMLEDGVFSFSWPLDEVVRRDAVTRMRPWAEARLGSLDRPRRMGRHITWRAYDLR